MTGTGSEGSTAGIPVCWRCRESEGPLREVAHPDPECDRRVRICVDDCWLPAAHYRCHRCEADVPRREMRFVESTTHDLVPECLDCNRAVVSGE